MGIGGIGMSAIAQLLQHKGYIVSGCDAVFSDRIKMLHHNGIAAQAPHCGTELAHHKISTIITSRAIASQHQELLTAQENGINVLSRADAMPYLTQDMFVIAVTGTHGKTTTTALIGHLLTQAGYDPNVLVGGWVHQWNSNVRLGHSNILVIEADESDRSFLHVSADITVITSINYDHTVTYTGLSDILATFQRYINTASPYTWFITCRDDQNLQQLTLPTNRYTYGLHIMSHYQCVETENTLDGQRCRIQTPQEDSFFYIPLPGVHNTHNLLASIVVGEYFGISHPRMQSALKNFSGIQHRYEYITTAGMTPCYHDYAHHPVEITHILQALTTCGYQYPGIIFQPHRYSRCATLWNAFIAAFSHITRGSLYVMEIYPAEEPIRYDISMQHFIEQTRTQHPHLAVKDARNTPFSEIATWLKSECKQHDIYIALGAGDVFKVFYHL